MNKILAILSIALLVAHNSHGQVEQHVDTVLRTKDFVAFKAFTDTFSDRNSRISGHWEILRDITGEYREGVFVFQQSVPDKHNAAVSSVYRFRTHIVATGTAIVYYELSAIRNKKVDGEWEPYFDPIDAYRNEQAMDSLNAAFKAVFHADLDETELFTSGFVYGEHCGFIGTDPEGRGQVHAMVARKDKAGLVKWLQSANTEKQVYAIDGLHQLTKLDIRLTEEELQMIEAVKNKSGNVFVCSGCIYGQRDIRSVTHQFRF